MKWFAGILGVYAVVTTAVASDVGMEEVRMLGQLNGLALACTQKANISRIKAVMIAHVPKTRGYGEEFETSSQEAFLQRSKEPEACGDDPVVALKVETLASRLQQLFPQEGK